MFSSNAKPSFPYEWGVVQQYPNQSLPLQLHLPSPPQAHAPRPNPPLPSPGRAIYPHCLPAGLNSFPKMCQISKFKYFHNNQMAYIQQFLEESLPGYLQRVIRQRCRQGEFLDYRKSGNVFELVVDLLQLGREQGLKWAQRTQQLLQQHLVISYEELQAVKMHPREGDSPTVTIIKETFGYVQILLLQLMLRILQLYLPSVHSQSPPDAAILRQITYIYPALKTELSFSHPHINLSQWFEALFLRLSTHHPFTFSFSQALQQISQHCSFIGPIEHIIDKFTRPLRFALPTLPTLPPTLPTLAVVPAPLRKPSGSLIMAEKSERSASREGTFNDLQTFRRKKKIILKERVREQVQTPVKEKEFMRNSPKTEKTEDFRSLFDRDSSKHSSPLFRRLPKPRRALDRTLYFGEKKRFLSRTPQHDLFEPLAFPLATSASTIASDLPTFEGGRKTQKKRRFEAEDDLTGGYCVPETPKPAVMSQRVGRESCCLDGFGLQKKGWGI